ncbi:hypothetical protein SCRM01_182 [Synechococcus phage S-CRM01]|uniref:hypothetical protein n=1 Tax=Synechococcus phage S-CRM01 TaxID=1026955 RepID=UPI000209E407|nr:hypothetical protein SCRM01_182 [Synechococcus phage S-CRM01]AEC53128.1 hypothetical protein SCRM01_182 [Synechococcus phage S-CRM01]
MTINNLDDAARATNDLLKYHRDCDMMGVDISHRLFKDLIEIMKKYGESQYRVGYKSGCDDTMV